MAGSYPRPDWFKLHLKKQEGSQKGVAGLIDDRYVKALKQVLDEQDKAQIQLKTDGQLLWHNMLCHLCYKIEGFAPGGLIRFYDNNMYYQKPRVESELKRKNSIILSEYLKARESGHDIKPVLSCYTLTKLSSNSFYSSDDDFLQALASVLNQEARDLADAGARVIQVDEPALLSADKEGLEIAKKAFEVLVKDVDASFVLSTYYADASKAFAELLEFPVQGIGLDFVEGKDINLKLIKEHGLDLDLQAGVVDARTTRMEDPANVSKLVSEITKAVDSDRLYVCPNMGLEYLPYVKAAQKLSVLSDSIRGGVLR